MFQWKKNNVETKNKRSRDSFKIIIFMTKSEALREMSEETAKPGTREALERVSAHTRKNSFNFIKHDLPTQFSILELITLHV